MTMRVKSTTQVLRVDPANQSVVLTLAGPMGPTGVAGDGGGGDAAAEVAAHNTAEVVHPNATSGRDFSALFQNGLI